MRDTFGMREGLRWRENEDRGRAGGGRRRRMREGLAAKEAKGSLAVPAKHQ